MHPGCLSDCPKKPICLKKTTAERFEDWCQQPLSTWALLFKVKLICGDDYRVITSRKGATASSVSTPVCKSGFILTFS